MNPLSGQVAIITGGGTGIGRGVAVGLAKHGAKVVVCGRRQAPLDDTVSAITEALGADTSAKDVALAVQADVSDENQVERLVQTAL